MKINYTSFTVPCPAPYYTYIFTRNILNYNPNNANMISPGIYENQCVRNGYPNVVAGETGSQLTSVNGTTYYTTCPSGSSQVGNRCLTCPNPGDFFDTIQILDANFNFISATYTGNRSQDWPCVSSCGGSKKIINKTCVSSCPNGYYTSGINCVKCGNGLFVDTAGNNCVVNCSSAFTYKNACVTTCPSFTYSDSARRCILVCSGMLFIWANTCSG